jgi:aminopeptidase-like protein
MNITDLERSAGLQEAGQEMYSLIAELYPLCRSITGEGFRQTMEILRRQIPLTVYEVPSGTKVFDWEVPREWNIRDAYIKNAEGKKVVDFQKSNLHILNYSSPVKKVVSLSELKEHLFTVPAHPDWVPYRTSYYQENWGFCLSHNEFLALEEGKYEVFIDSTLENGCLNYGELYLKGEEEDEILISCHACHPSLANDNLSGVSLASLLAKRIGSVTHRYSYRFLFIPGTIGAIAWLAQNEEKVSKIKHGLVLSGLGDGGNITYKRSRRGNTDIDRAAGLVLEHSGSAYELIDFSPYGYDERQYCSPGFNLPVGGISRTPFGKYPEYHTSADNLEFVRPEFLADSYDKVLAILSVLENNRFYRNLCPKCEPQLGRRGLYSSIGVNELALLWVLNYSDGSHHLLDISEKSGINFTSIQVAAQRLATAGLLKECAKQ